MATYSELYRPGTLIWAKNEKVTDLPIAQYFAEREQHEIHPIDAAGRPTNPLFCVLSTLNSTQMLLVVASNIPGQLHPEPLLASERVEKHTLTQ